MTDQPIRAAPSPAAGVPRGPGGKA